MLYQAIVMYVPDFIYLLTEIQNRTTYRIVSEIKFILCDMLNNSQILSCKLSRNGNTYKRNTARRVCVVSNTLIVILQSSKHHYHHEVLPVQYFKVYEMSWPNLHSCIMLTDLCYGTYANEFRTRLKYI